MENKEIIEVLNKIIAYLSVNERDNYSICIVKNRILNSYDEHKIISEILSDEFKKLDNYRCFDIRKREVEYFRVNQEGEGLYHFENVESRIKFLKDLIIKLKKYEK